VTISEQEYAEILSRPGFRVVRPTAQRSTPAPVQVKAEEPKRNKFHAKKTEVDGITFYSKREATRYQDLRAMQQHGLISDLVLQPRFPLIVNDVKVGTYIADFQYVEDGKKIIEDVKAPHLRKHMYYRLKNRLMRAIYGIEIRET